MQLYNLRGQTSCSSRKINEIGEINFSLLVELSWQKQSEELNGIYFCLQTLNTHVQKRFDDVSQDGENLSIIMFSRSRQDKRKKPLQNKILSFDNFKTGSSNERYSAMWYSNFSNWESWKSQ
jgi:hypothetical protein